MRCVYKMNCPNVNYKEERAADIKEKRKEGGQEKERKKKYNVSDIKPHFNFLNCLSWNIH